MLGTPFPSPSSSFCSSHSLNVIFFSTVPLSPSRPGVPSSISSSSFSSTSGGLHPSPLFFSSASTPGAPCMHHPDTPGPLGSTTRASLGHSSFGPAWSPAIAPAIAAEGAGHTLRMLALLDEDEGDAERRGRLRRLVGGTVHLHRLPAAVHGPPLLPLSSVPSPASSTPSSLPSSAPSSTVVGVCSFAIVVRQCHLHHRHHPSSPPPSIALSPPCTVTNFAPCRPCRHHRRRLPLPTPPTSSSPPSLASSAIIAIISSPRCLPLLRHRFLPSPASPASSSFPALASADRLQRGGSPAGTTASMRRQQVTKSTRKIKKRGKK